VINKALLLLAAPLLMGATERADIKDFERYDSTQTCIFTFYPPKTMKKYELVVKPKWKKYRKTSWPETVIIQHNVCSDKNWYAYGGMIPRRAIKRYQKMFGIKFVGKKK
jgi:hypothetical protein